MPQDWSAISESVAISLVSSAMAGGQFRLDPSTILVNASLLQISENVLRPRITAMFPKSTSAVIDSLSKTISLNILRMFLGGGANVATLMSRAFIQQAMIESVVIYLADVILVPTINEFFAKI